MHMTAKFPWNGSELLRKEWEKDNYRIVRTGASTKRAIIFFSGNGLYFPNNEEAFTDTITIRDRYEWENIARTKQIRQYYELIIFVRDVYKQWYITGINTRYDSADKTAEFLCGLTRGFQVTTCGNSAGGYAAVLFAHLIGAKRFFSVSGQFSILHEIDNPFVEVYASDPERNKYFSIAALAGGGGATISGRMIVN